MFGSKDLVPPPTKNRLMASVLNVKKPFLLNSLQFCWLLRDELSPCLGYLYSVNAFVIDLGFQFLLYHRRRRRQKKWSPRWMRAWWTCWSTRMTATLSSSSNCWPGSVTVNILDFRLRTSKASDCYRISWLLMVEFHFHFHIFFFFFRITFENNQTTSNRLTLLERRHNSWMLFTPPSTKRPLILSFNSSIPWTNSAR